MQKQDQHWHKNNNFIAGKNVEGVTCCQNGQIIQESLRHPDCFLISIPANDTFFAQHNQRCMEFVRSLPAVRSQCTLGPREQQNAVTAFIDESHIYGSKQTEARELRTLVGGRMKIQRSVHGHALLPENKKECTDVTKKKFCFKTGNLNNHSILFKSHVNALIF